MNRFFDKLVCTAYATISDLVYIIILIIMMIIFIPLGLVFSGRSFKSAVELVEYIATLIGETIIKQFETIKGL